MVNQSNPTKLQEPQTFLQFSALFFKQHLPIIAVLSEQQVNLQEEAYKSAQRILLDNRSFDIQTQDRGKAMAATKSIVAFVEDKPLPPYGKLSLLYSLVKNTPLTGTFPFHSLKPDAEVKFNNLIQLGAYIEESMELYS